MNFERFLHIISKWPVEEKRVNMSYGTLLRSLAKRRDVDGNVFSGNSVENSRKLDALLRLLNNTYNNKYPCTKKSGGSGLDKKSVELILDKECSKMSDVFLKEIENQSDAKKIDSQ